MLFRHKKCPEMLLHAGRGETGGGQQIPDGIEVVRRCLSYADVHYLVPVNVMLSSPKGDDSSSV